LNLTSKGIDEVLSEQRKAGSFLSTKDILMQRYFLRKSYIDSIAFAYGETSWWMRMALLSASGCLLVIIAATIQLSVLAVLTSLVCLSIGFVAHTVLQNHYDTVCERSTLICNDIEVLEKDLQAHCDYLQETEVRLDAVFEKLSVESEEFASDADAFNTCVTKLQGKIDVLKQSITELESQKQDLAQRNKNLQDKIIQLSNNLESVDQQIEDKSTQISQITDNISQTSHTLREKTDALDGMPAIYQERIDTLASLEKEMKSCVETLNSTIMHAQKPISELEVVQEFEYLRKSGAKQSADVKQCLAEISEITNTRNAFCPKIV